MTPTLPTTLPFNIEMNDTNGMDDLLDWIKIIYKSITLEDI